MIMMFMMIFFSVPRNNHINFGDCALCVANHQSFTLTNHSENDIIRFTWDPPPQFTFSPCTGHLLPNCAKDIKVTFESEKPTKLEAVQIPCKISKIQLAQNAAKVRFILQSMGSKSLKKI